MTLADRIRNYLDLQSLLDKCRAGGLDTERAAAAVAAARDEIRSAMAGREASEYPPLAEATEAYLDAERDFGESAAAGVSLDGPAERMGAARRDLKRQLHATTWLDAETVHGRRVTPPPVRPAVSDPSDDRGAAPEPSAGKGLRRILVAFDGSAPARVALEAAVKLAGRVGAELIVLDVVRPATGAGGEYVCSLEHLDQLHRSEGEQLLARVRRELPRGMRSVALLAEGVPADEILIAARTRAADLIVIGTRGRGRLARFLLGGTADAVIRRAPCPVMTVASPARCAGHPAERQARAVPAAHASAGLAAG
jgi:nucleotide-binding universal stress UspA family protein